MEMTLNIPDDLMRELERRAAERRTPVAEAAIDAVRAGLGADPARPAEPGRVAVNPRTGGPLIECGPGPTPMQAMSTEQVYDLIHRAQEEEDLERIAAASRR